MIGLLFAVGELVAILLYAFLKITGLWISLLVVIVSMLFHTYVMPISDSIASFTIYASFIPSGLLFLRNVYTMLYNIMTWIRNLVY